MKKVLLILTLLCPIFVSAFTTNSTTGADSIQVWAESAGPLKLFSIAVSNYDNAARFLMLFANDSPVNGDRPITVWAITNNQQYLFSYSPDGLYVRSFTGGSLRQGCTFWMSTTSTTLTKSTTTKTDFTYIKMAQTDVSTALPSDVTIALHPDPVDSTLEIQSAINQLIQGNTYLSPSGGRITFSPGIYYITNTLLASNNYCGDLELFGPGLMSGGIVLRSPTAMPLLKVTSKATAAGADAVCPMGIRIHGLFLGVTNNTPTNIVEINDFARAEIDHNWIGWWNAMTNNNTVGVNAVGFSTCTFGNGVSNTALVGISIRGISDLAEIHGNSFLGCAASIYLASDHMRVWNNFSSYCGISNTCVNTSPFSIGAAFVVQPDLSHNDLYLDGNFFYNCQVGYLIFATNGNLSYNYNTVSSKNDTFEATPTNVCLSANVRMKQYDASFLRASSNNSAIVSISPTFAVQNGRIENDRVQSISTRTNRLTLSGSDLILGNGRAGILNTVATATNSFRIYSCGIAAVNNVYTNPLAGPDNDPGNFIELIYTNGTTGYYLMWDPQSTVIIGGGTVAVFNNLNVQQYSWKESPDDPLIWQALPISAGGGTIDHGTAPVGQLQPTLTGVKTIFTGDGSGLTNLPSSEIGVTDGSTATAGNVGQVLSSLRAVGSATGLSSGVASNVVSISLTAGDWDVMGSINFVGTTATASILEGGISTTSLTLPTDGSEVFSGVTALGNGTDSVTVSRKVVNVSSTTVTYLVGKTTFSVGTVAVYGSITARRIR